MAVGGIGPADDRQPQFEAARKPTDEEIWAVVGSMMRRTAAVIPLANKTRVRR
jgi:hypothetical protein